jgi:biotin carboxyl carrier protein
MNQSLPNFLQSSQQANTAARDGELIVRLQKILTDLSDANRALALFRILAIEYAGVLGAAHIRIAQMQQWSIERGNISGQITIDELKRPVVQALYTQVTTQNKQLRVRSGEHELSEVLLTPVVDEDDTRSVLLVKLRADSDARAQSRASTVLQLIAAFHELWFTKAGAVRQHQLFEASAAVIELVSVVEASKDTQHACFAIVQEVRRYLNCLAVCVGTVEGNRFVRLANSDLVNFNPQHESFPYFEKAWQETSIHNDVNIWPPQPGETRHGLIQHRKLVEHLRVEAALSVALHSDAGKLTGALTILGTEKEICDPATINFLRCISDPLGGTLELLHRAAQGPVRRFLALAAQKTTGKRVALALAGCALVGGLMLVPIPYRIRCNCQTDALQRRYVAAPFDGVIKQGFVRPGDIVHADQLLAEMQGREIRQELAAATFEKQRAEKKRDLFLADDHVAESLLADLESRQLNIKTDLLENRQENLQITAPMDGIVLDGDLDQAQDQPVQVGQTLFEISAIDPIKVRVAVPSDEVSNVRPHMNVRIWLSGLGSRSLTGHIDRVLPAAELVDDQHAFIAEIIIDNPDQLLRPGMRGTATITSDARSLGWNLFHKPWEYVVSRLNW